MKKIAILLVTLFGCLSLMAQNDYYLEGIEVNLAPQSLNYSSDLIFNVSVNDNIRFIFRTNPYASIFLGVTDPVAMQSKAVEVVADANGNFRYPTSFLESIPIQNEGWLSFQFGNGQTITINSVNENSLKNEVIDNVITYHRDFGETIDLSEITLDPDLIEYTRFTQNINNGETISTFDWDAVERGRLKFEQFAEDDFENFVVDIAGSKAYNVIIYGYQGVICAGGIATAAGTAGAGTGVAVAACTPLGLHVVRDITNEVVVPNLLENGKISENEANIISGSTDVIYAVGSFVTPVAAGVDGGLAVLDATDFLLTLSEANAEFKEAYKLNPIDENYDAYKIIYIKDGIDYSLLFKYEKPGVLQDLSQGQVNPNPGSTNDTYYFSVNFADLTGANPQSVNLKINGGTIPMDYESGTITNGATYSTSYSNNVADVYDYYFEATAADGTVIRYPESGSLALNITESIAGWELWTESITATPKYMLSPEEIIVSVEITNMSDTQDKTYYNVPYRFDIYSPSGTLEDFDTGTLTVLTKGGTAKVSGKVTPNNVDGSHQIIFTVNPDKDNDLANNSKSIPIIIGADGPTHEYIVKDGWDWVWMDANTPTKSFNGHTYTLQYVSGSKISISEDGGSQKDILTYDFREFNSYTDVLICEAVNTVGNLAAMVSFGSANSNIVKFASTNVSGFPGETVVLKAQSSGGDFANSDPDFYKDTPIEDWFRDFNLSNGDATVEFEFRIPSGQSPGVYKFYMGARMDPPDALFLRELSITVLASLPSITSLSAYSVSADDELTISGTNLGTSGTVKFSSLATTQIFSWSATQIKCIVPEGVSNGVLTVTNSVGISNGMSYSVVNSTGDPELIQPIQDLSMNQNQTRLVADLSNVFSDPNNDELSYIVTINGSGITYNVDKLTADSLELITTREFMHDAVVQVVATDADNSSVADTFIVFAPIIPHSLSWPQTDEFTTDGVTPNGAYVNQLFTYAVQVTPGTYALAEGYPKLHIQRNNLEISESPFSMVKNLVFTDESIVIPGDFYGFETSLPEGRTYSYYIELEDVESNSATGIPINKHYGPSVNPLPIPVAEFESNIQSVTAGDSVSFIDLSANAPTSWIWDFGDGTTSTLQNPIHQYNAPTGWKTVSLIAINEYGGDTIVKENYIEVVSSCEISLNRRELNMVESGGSLYTTVICGSDWQIISYPSWLLLNKLSGSGTESFKATFTESTDTPRSGEIVISTCNDVTTILPVKQDGTVSCELSLNRRKLSMESDGGSLYTTVTCNSDWKITSFPAWAELNKLSGTGVESFKTTLPAHVGLPRSGEIVVTTCENLTVTLAVIQEGTIPCELSLNRSKISMTSEGGSLYTTVTSNAFWEITSFPDWVTLNKLSGTGTESFKATFGVNDGMPLSGEIVVKTCENLTAVITVFQAGTEGCELSLNRRQLSMPASGGSLYTTVSSNALWEITSYPAWLTLNKLSAIGINSFKATFSVNEGSSRNGAIVIETCGGLTEVLPVSQEGMLKSAGVTVDKGKDIQMEGIKVYPNPFHQEVRIAFTRMEEEDAEIIIFDVMGRKIRELKQELMEGYNEVIWDGTDQGGAHVKAGIYLVNFRSNLRQEVVRVSYHGN